MPGWKLASSSLVSLTTMLHMLCSYGTSCSARDICRLGVQVAEGDNPPDGEDCHRGRDESSEGAPARTVVDTQTDAIYHAVKACKFRCPHGKVGISK